MPPEAANLGAPQSPDIVGPEHEGSASTTAGTEHHDAELAGVDFSGLIPPAGALYGRTTEPLSLSVSLASCGGVPGGPQTVSTDLNFTLFTYLENGVTPSRYVAVVVVWGNISPVSPSHTLISDDADARGWFQWDFPLAVSLYKSVERSLPFRRPIWTPFPPDTVTLAGHSPTSSENQEQILVGLKTEMTLLVDSEGGSVPQTWVASLEDFMGLKGWAVDDMAASDQPGWYFYQAEPWSAKELKGVLGLTGIWSPFDPRVPGVGSLADLCFSGTAVKPLPQLTTSSFNVVTACAWRFDPSLIVNGSMPVVFAVRHQVDYSMLTTLYNGQQGQWICADWYGQTTIFSFDLAELLGKH